MPVKVAFDRRPSLAGARNTATACCFSQENACLPPGSVKSAEPLDIGGFQYPSAARSRSALLQALDSSDVFGSPTWARTRDLRINSRPLVPSASRHECCAFRAVVSNISCLLRPSRARGRHPPKHWILEASGGSLHTRERAHDAIVRAWAAFGKIGWKRHTALCCRGAASRSRADREGWGVLASLSDVGALVSPTNVGGWGRRMPGQGPCRRPSRCHWAAC